MSRIALEDMSLEDRVEGWCNNPIVTYGITIRFHKSSSFERIIRTFNASTFIDEDIFMLNELGYWKVDGTLLPCILAVHLDYVSIELDNYESIMKDRNSNIVNPILVDIVCAAIYNALKASPIYRPGSGVSIKQSMHAKHPRLIFVFDDMKMGMTFKIDSCIVSVTISKIMTNGTCVEPLSKDFEVSTLFSQSQVHVQGIIDMLNEVLLETNKVDPTVPISIDWVDPSDGMVELERH